MIPTHYANIYWFTVNRYWLYNDKRLLLAMFRPDGRLKIIVVDGHWDADDRYIFCTDKVGRYELTDQPTQSLERDLELLASYFSASITDEMLALERETGRGPHMSFCLIELASSVVMPWEQQQ